MTQPTAHMDVAVIGGGPSGMAAAIAARAKGLSVLVLDSARPPIDKVCGEGIMPDGRAALKKLGVHIDERLAFPFRGISFVEGETCLQAAFPSGTGLGLRRTVLHGLLVERARAVGARLEWGATVTGISPGCVHVGNTTVRCRWIVGADGIHSRVRRWAGLESFARDTRRFAFRAHYRVAPWSDYMQIHWGPDCQLYVTPVAADEICIIVISRNPKLRLADALAKMPEAARRLNAAERSTVEGGALTSTRRLRSVWRDDVVLVGDASGCVDAITGEGLCLSFHHALALADALVSGDLEAYAAEHRKCARRPSFMADLMLTLGTRPRLRRKAVRVLASQPELFGTMLAAHVGARSPGALVSTALALGWRMLYA